MTRPRRPVRELHQAARPDRPDRAALGHFRLDRSGGARDQAPLPETIALKRRDRGLDRQPEGLADCSPPPSPRNGCMTATACRTGASPATSTGASRCKRGRSRGPAWRARSSTSGSTRPSNISPRTAEWADANGRTDADWERWWRTDKGAEDVRYVQFMGKDNVPFHTLSFPATIMGSREPWKTGRLHQVLQLPQLRRRPVLDQPRPRRLHGPSALVDPAIRLLALVAAVPRARKLPTASSPGRTSRRRSTRTLPTCSATSSAASPSSAARNTARLCPRAARPTRTRAGADRRAGNPHPRL